MTKLKARFQFTVDNAQLALNEIEHQIKNIGLSAEDMKIISSTPIEKKPDEDWFDDYTFIIAATVCSNKYDEDEIKKLIADGSFEDYEFIE